MILSISNNLKPKVWIIGLKNKKAWWVKNENHFNVLVTCMIRPGTCFKLNEVSFEFMLSLKLAQNEHFVNACHGSHYEHSSILFLSS